MQTCAIQHVSRYPRGCGRILEEYNRCMWVNFEIHLQPPPWTTRVCALLKLPIGVECICNVSNLSYVKNHIWNTVNLYMDGIIFTLPRYSDNI